MKSLIMATKLWGYVYRYAYYLLIPLATKLFLLKKNIFGLIFIMNS